MCLRSRRCKNFSTCDPRHRRMRPRVTGSWIYPPVCASSVRSRLCIQLSTCGQIASYSDVSSLIAASIPSESDRTELHSRGSTDSWSLASFFPPLSLKFHPHWVRYKIKKKHFYKSSSSFIAPAYWFINFLNCKHEGFNEGISGLQKGKAGSAEGGLKIQRQRNLWV